MLRNPGVEPVSLEQSEPIALLSDLTAPQKELADHAGPVAACAVRVARVLAMALGDMPAASQAEKVDPSFPCEIATDPVKYPDRRSPEYVKALQEVVRKKLTHLTPAEQQVMLEVVARNAPALWIEGAGPSTVRGVQFEVELEPGARPLRAQPWRLGPEEQAKLERKIQAERSKGTLVPLSSGAWSSRAFTVYHPSDPNGRLVIDYRAVNKLTKRMSFPMPQAWDTRPAGSRSWAPFGVSTRSSWAHWQRKCWLSPPTPGSGPVTSYRWA